MTTTATTYPDDERPVIVGRYRHWVRLQWPDGRIEVASTGTAARLGAVESNTNQPRRTP